MNKFISTLCNYSYMVSILPARKNEVNFEDIGLPKYTGPKRKDYVTKESRVKTYSKWPERLEQTPEEMAEAGFFYCGKFANVSGIGFAS